MAQNLSKSTIQVIQDLQKDLQEILNSGSNIEAIWKLEKLHQNNALLKSSEYIRKSLQVQNMHED